MQKPRFCLGARVTPPSPGLCWPICVMGAGRANGVSSGFLAGDSALRNQVSVAPQEDQETQVRGSEAAHWSEQPYLDLVQGPVHLHSLYPHRHAGLAVGQVPARLGLTLRPEAAEVLVVGHLDTVAAQDWPRPLGFC